MLDKPIKLSKLTRARLRIFKATEICKTYDDAIIKLLDCWKELQDLKKEIDPALYKWQEKQKKESKA